MTDHDIIFAATPDDPFPTPVVSVDPAYQELYQEWVEQRDAKPVTLAEKLGAIKASADANSQIVAMSITMIAVCIVLKILFCRVAAKRRKLVSRMTAAAWGRVTKVRRSSVGRQTSFFASVGYENNGVERCDEYLLGGWKSHQEGDVVKVRYDPHDAGVSMLDDAKIPNGREFDVVLIPLFAIGVIVLLWVLL